MNTLLDIYTKEFAMVTLKELEKTPPVMQMAVHYMEQGSKNAGYFGGTYGIYPQFTKTLAYLRSIGIREEVLSDEVNPADVNSITVVRYGETVDGIYVDEYSEAVYTAEENKDMLEQICEHIVADNVRQGNYILYPTEESCEVRLELKTDGASGVHYAYFRKGETPDFVYQDLKNYVAE